MVKRYTNILGRGDDWSYVQDPVTIGESNPFARVLLSTAAPNEPGSLSAAVARVIGTDYQPVEIPEDAHAGELLPRGFIAGTLGLGEAINTAIEVGGGFVGAERVEAFGRRGAEYWRETAEPFQPPKSIQGNVVDNPRMLLDPDYWMYGIGNMAPSLLASLIPGLGAAAAVEKFAALSKVGNVAVRTIQAATKGKLGTKALSAEKLAAMLGGGLVAGPLEGSSTYKQSLGKGRTKKEARRDYVLMSVGSGILNALAVGEALFPGVKDAHRLIRYGVSALTEAVTEGLEEPFEALILDESMIEATKQAFTVAPLAFVMGGGAAVFGDVARGKRRRDAAAANEAKKEEFINTTRTLIAGGKLSPETAAGYMQSPIFKAMGVSEGRFGAMLNEFREEPAEEPPAPPAAVPEVDKEKVAAVEPEAVEVVAEPAPEVVTEPVAEEVVAEPEKEEPPKAEPPKAEVVPAPAVEEVVEEVVEEEPAPEPAPEEQRYKVGKSPETYTVIEELPSEEGDLDDETFVEIRSDRDGGTQIVTKGELTPVKTAKKPEAVAEPEKITPTEPKAEAAIPEDLKEPIGKYTANKDKIDAWYAWGEAQEDGSDAKLAWEEADVAGDEAADELDITYAKDNYDPIVKSAGYDSFKRDNPELFSEFESQYVPGKKPVAVKPKKEPVIEAVPEAVLVEEPVQEEVKKAEREEDRRKFVEKLIKKAEVAPIALKQTLGDATPKEYVSIIENMVADVKPQTFDNVHELLENLADGLLKANAKVKALLEADIPEYVKEGALKARTVAKAHLDSVQIVLDAAQKGIKDLDALAPTKKPKLKVVKKVTEADEFTKGMIGLKEAIKAKKEFPKQAAAYLKTLSEEEKTRFLLRKSDEEKERIISEWIASQKEEPVAEEPVVEEEVVEEPEEPETKLSAGKLISVVVRPEYIAELSEDVIGWMSDVLPPEAMKKVKLEIKKNIGTKGRNITQTAKDYGGVIPENGKGAATVGRLEALIEISYQQGERSMERTSYHEAFHVVAKWLLPSETYLNLMAEFDGNEENMAEAFAGYSMDREYSLAGKKSLVRKIFDQFVKLFNKIKSKLAVKGYETSADVFENVWRGEYKDKRRTYKIPSEPPTQFSVKGEPTIEEMIAGMKAPVTKTAKAPKKKKVTFEDILALVDKPLPAVAKKQTTLQQRYDALKRFVEDKHKSIVDKQKKLKDFINSMPMHVRGKSTARVPAIAKLKTIEGQQRAMVREAKKAVATLDAYLKSESRKAVDKILKKVKPKRMRNRALRGRLDKPLRNILPEIKGIMEMSESEVQTAIENINLDISVDPNFDGTEAERAEAEIKAQVEFALYSNFGNFSGKTGAEQDVAVKELKRIVKDSKASLAVKIKEEREARKERTIKAAEVIQGDAPTISNQEAKNRQKVFWAKLRSDFRNFFTKQQSWEWLMDELEKRNIGKTLSGYLAKTYGRMTHRATNSYKAGMQVHRSMVLDGLEEVYGATGRRLGKILDAKSKPGQYKVTTKQGTENISKNEAIHRWMMWQNDKVREKLIDRGFGEDSFRQIETIMSGQDVAWAEWMIVFYDTYYDGINDIYEKLYYATLPKVDNYVPIRVDRNIVEEQDMMSADQFFASMIKGSLKMRVEHSMDFRYMDADEVLVQHIAEMEHFKAWAEPIRELRSVFSSKEARDAMDKYHPGAKGVVEHFIDGFVRNGIDHRNVAKWLDVTRSTFTKMVLAVNPVVFMKQLTSIPAFAMDMDAGAWSLELSNLMSRPDLWVKRLGPLLKTTAMQERYYSGFERDMIKVISRAGSKKLTGKKNLSDIAMFTTKLGDAGAILIGGWPVYNHFYKKAKADGMTHEEAHTLAVEEFELRVARTQQAGDVKDLGYYQSKGSFEKLFTMFMTTPASYWRQEYGAVRNILYRRGHYADNAKRFAIAHFMLPMMFQFVASGFQWEDDEMKRAAAIGSLNGVFILRDFVQSIAEQIFIGKFYGGVGSPPPFEYASDIARLSIKTGQGKVDLDDFARMMAVTRVAYGMFELATGETEYTRRALGYSEANIESGLADQSIWEDLFDVPAGNTLSGVPSKPVSNRKFKSLSLNTTKIPTRTLRQATQEARK